MMRGSDEARSRDWIMTFACTSLALVVCSSLCLGQPQEVFEGRRWRLLSPQKGTPTIEIRKALENGMIATTDFSEEKPLHEFLAKFEAAISKKDKHVRLMSDD